MRSGRLGPLAQHTTFFLLVATTTPFSLLGGLPGHAALLLLLPHSLRNSEGPLRHSKGNFLLGSGGSLYLLGAWSYGLIEVSAFDLFITLVLVGLLAVLAGLLLLLPLFLLLLGDAQLLEFLFLNIFFLLQLPLLLELPL